MAAFNRHPDQESPSLMPQRNSNLIDKLAGIIPGYRGYADRDARRIADKRLRENVATDLIRAQSDIHDLVLRRVEAGRLIGLDELDRFARELGTCADALRHAPAGGSGLMDDVVIKAADLDRVHQHDLDLRQAASELVAAVASASRETDSDDLLALRPRMHELRDAIRHRESVLHQVFD